MVLHAHKFTIMAPEPSTTRRKRYDSQTYAKLTDDLLNTLDGTPHLRLSRDDWDIEGDWGRAGTIHFIDMVHQPSFERFTDFDCRSIKLVNLGKPAVRMTFYAVHKYWLVKSNKLSSEERAERIDDYINHLLINIEIKLEKMQRMSGVKRTEVMGKIGAMRQELQEWSIVRDNPEGFDIAVSNYHRDHIYTNINFKYVTDLDEFDNEQIHLLTSQRDGLGTITQVRHNIVFVDTEHILRDHPYQNKTVERYLNQFMMKTSFNRDHLYARKRTEVDSIATFETMSTQDTPLPVERPVAAKKRGPKKRLPTLLSMPDLFSRE